MQALQAIFSMTGVRRENAPKWANGSQPPVYRSSSNFHQSIPQSSVLYTIILDFTYDVRFLYASRFSGGGVLKNPNFDDILGCCPAGGRHFPNIATLSSRTTDYLSLLVQLVDVVCNTSEQNG